MRRVGQRLVENADSDGKKAHAEVDFGMQAHRARRGFSLIEVIAVLVLLGILGGIATKRYLDARAAARERAIDAAIAELNGREKLAWAQQLMAHGAGLQDTAVFGAVQADELAMYVWETGPNSAGVSQLSFQGFEAELLRTGADATQSGHWRRFSGIYHDFGSAAVSDYLPQPSEDNWSGGAGGFTTDDYGSRLLIPNPLGAGEYAITTDVQLGDYDPSKVAGYGVFFNAVPSANGQTVDSGLIVQFDPGLGSGEIIIRSWENGRESDPLLRVNDRSLIPDHQVEPAWWRAAHDLELRVTTSTVDPSKRSLQILLDGNEVSSGFEFTPAAGESYTGFRSWGTFPSTTTQFTSMQIDDPGP